MATKKITLNELRNLVKQIIKEERMLNEDNLQVKRIAKDLYLYLKKNGVNVRLIASVPQSGINKRIGANDGAASDNGASIYYWDDQKTKQTEIEIHLTGDEQKIQEVERKLLSTYPGLEQYNRDLIKGGGIDISLKYRGTDKEGTVSRLIFRVKEKTTAKGGLVGNTQQNQKQPSQQQPVSESLKLKNLVKQIIKEENTNNDINQLVDKIKNYLKGLGFTLINEERFDKIKDKVEKGALEDKDLAGVGIVEYAEGNNVAVSIGMPSSSSKDTYELTNKIMGDIKGMTKNFKVNWYRGKLSINCSIQFNWE